jgi:pyruvate/oxaloacetate carboxyltransferase
MKKEMVPYSDQEEDILIYALYPAVAKDYFETLRDPLKLKAREESLKGKALPEGHPLKRFVLRINGSDYDVGVTELD